MICFRRRMKNHEGDRIVPYHGTVHDHVHGTGRVDRDHARNQENAITYAQIVTNAIEYAAGAINHHLDVMNAEDRDPVHRLVCDRVLAVLVTHTEVVTVTDHHLDLTVGAGRVL